MTTRVWTLVFTVLLVAQSVSISFAEQKPDDKASAQERPLKLRTEEVIVDAIVTDKKNRVVGDLAAEDFELFEDGVKQKIVSFRYESNSQESRTGAQTDKSNRASGTADMPNLVSLVLDGETTRDGALRARRAALEFIDNGIGPNDYVAVFGIDLGLLVLSPYTNDRQGLKKAVEAFTSKESKKYLEVAGEVKTQLESLVSPLSDASRVALADSTHEFEQVQPPTETVDVRGADRAVSIQQLMITTVALTGLRVLRTFQRYEREFQGWRSVSALLAIINGQRSVRAGRKTVLLFSEGFAVSPAVKQQYMSIISSANTSGVTLYALDIAGLRVVNPNEETMIERDASARARLRNQSPELVSGGVSALGKTEEVARLNTVTTLDELTEETGGYAVKNTNDLTDGLKRILEELGSHYVLTYLPSNQNYQGEFRRISLKLPKSGDFKLRARQGYYALRTLDDMPVMGYEVPLLERANATGMSSDFPLSTQGLHFRGTPAARQIALFAEFPLSSLSFDTDPKAKQFSSKFAVLVLVKNQSGEIVRKVGQEFALKGPLPQLEEVKKRPQIYSRIIALPPGRYRVEAVVRDNANGKTALANAPLEVPLTSEETLRMSSVVLSRGVNPLSEDQKKQNHPLYLEGQAYFVPNLQETFSLSREKNLLVHFDVYPPRDSKPKTQVTLTFLQNGSVFTEAAGSLPEPDANGKVSYSTSFGTENFPAGEYQLRVTVNDGPRNASSMTSFKIVP